MAPQIDTVAMLLLPPDRYVSETTVNASDALDFRHHNYKDMRQVSDDGLHSYKTRRKVKQVLFLVPTGLIHLAVILFLIGS